MEVVAAAEVAAAVAVAAATVAAAAAVAPVAAAIVAAVHNASRGKRFFAPAFLSAIIEEAVLYTPYITVGGHYRS